MVERVAGTWKLAADEIGLVVTGSYELRRVTIEYPNRVVAFAALAAPEASTVPSTSTQPVRLKFAETIWAQDAADTTPRDTAETLRRMRSYVPDLGRQPLVEWSWGGLSIEGWMSLQVEWIGGVFQLPPFLPRAVTVSVTITKAQQPRLLDAATGSAVGGETRFARIPPAGSFESVAMQHLGDPMLGVLLRRINTQIAATGEVVGDTVKVLERSHPAMQGVVVPIAPAFVGAYRTTLQDRAVSSLARNGLTLEVLEAEYGL